MVGPNLQAINQKAPRWRGLRQHLNYEPHYAITRKYPDNNYKWVALGLMIVLCVLFTIFNVATVGYDLQPLITSDPNTTIAKSEWFNKAVFTWGDDKLKPQCQTQNIPIGYQFMTTNEGMIYTVRGISSRDDSLRPPQLIQHSAVSYLNHTLENCQVNLVGVSLRKADNSKASPDGFWWSWAFSYSRVQAQCEITSFGDNYTITFDAPYNFGTKDFSFVVIDNHTTHASVWWGTRLLDNYARGIQSVMATGMYPYEQTDVEVANGEVDFRPANVTEIKGDKLFDVSFFFFHVDGSILNDDNAFPNHTDIPDVFFNNIQFLQSRSLTEGLSFAKILYSLVLVDLGQSGPPNILLDEDLLQYALAPPDNFNREAEGPLNNTVKLDWWRSRGITPPGQQVGLETSVPMNLSYQQFRDQTGPLGTKPAQMYMQYVCSVPTKKSTVTIVFLTLISNFVLLQAAWMILKFIADRFVEASDPTSMYCEGCFSTQSYQLTDMGTPQQALLSPVTPRKIPGSASTSTCGFLHGSSDDEE